MNVLAQAGLIEHWVLLALLVAAVVAIVCIAIRAMGVNIPGWAAQIFWVLVIVVVAILAIKVIFSLV